MSQSPFGFWGDWNSHVDYDLRNNGVESQSPFGFWGDWNKMENYRTNLKLKGHNRLSAFGVIGTANRFAIH